MARRGSAGMGVGEAWSPGPVPQELLGAGDRVARPVGRGSPPTADVPRMKAPFAPVASPGVAVVLVRPSPEQKT